MNRISAKPLTLFAPTDQPESAWRAYGPLVAFCLAMMAMTLAPNAAFAQEAENGGKPAKENLRSGQVITISGVIDTQFKNLVVDQARQAAERGVEVIIFEFESATGDFGACYELARALLALGGPNLQRTVAYSAAPIRGHVVLPALACDEIVLAEGAAIGDAARNEVGDASRTIVDAYGEVAAARGRSPDVARAMVDPSIRLYEATVGAAGFKKYLSDESLEAEVGVTEKDVFKPTGKTLLLTAREARRVGVIRLIAADLSEAAEAYNLPASLGGRDSLRGETDKPVLLRLRGTVNNRMAEFVSRRLQYARNRGYNLLIAEVDSSSGDYEAAERIANLLRGWEGLTVGYIPKRATGPATLALMGCDELVIGPEGQIGEVRMDEGSETEYARLAALATQLADGSRLPEAWVQALFDPDVRVFEARNKNTGVIDYRTETMLEDQGAANVWVKNREGAVKEAGETLSLTGDEAVDFAVARSTVETAEQAARAFGARGDLATLEAGLVDQIVDVLSSPGGTVFLLTAGIFCLYLELHMPGFGLPGVSALVCFGLFFWSRFLTGTANSLEVVLFLLGVLLLGIELFLTPGFAVPGITGLLLIISSVILASQGFALPSNEAEMRTLTNNLLALAVSGVVFVAAAAAFARYLPRMPLFNHIVLQPREERDEYGDPIEDEEEIDPEMLAAQAMVGRKGLAVTPLRPAGRMRFGEDYFDVIAQGEFVPEGAAVEVLEVYPTRIVVRGVEPA